MKYCEHRQQAAKNWDKWEKQWEAYRKEKDKDDWQSNHVVPLTTSIVEAALAEIIDQNWRPQILARGEEDKPKVAVVRHAFDYSWEIANGDLELYTILKDAFIKGTGIGQEYKWSERRRVQFLKTKAGERGPEQFTEEQEVTDFDDPYLEAVKLEDFFPDDRGRYFRVGPYSCRDAIRRYVMDIDDFREFFKGPIWDPLGNAKYVTPGGDTSYWEFYKPPEGFDKSRDVEVLWYWAKRPWDALFIVANDVMIRMGPNPYNHKRLPFARCVDIYRTHRFWGKGEAELLESIQDELNTIRRQRLDRAHLGLDPMYLISNREDIDETELIARPHGFIRVEDPATSARELRTSDTPPSSYMEEDRLKDDARRVTGIDERLQSVSSPRSETATEAAILKEATLKRLRAKLWLLSRTFLIEIGRLRVANILQFYSQPKLEKIIGEKRTKAYRELVKKARAQGLLKRINGEEYIQRYRTIRIKNRKLEVTEDGKIVEEKARGIHFFEVRPEYLLPIYGSYDIVYGATPTIPISKPLQQQRIESVLKHPLIQAAISSGVYDLARISDALLEAYDFDPEEFKAPSVMPEELISPEKAVALAEEENERIMAGEDIGPTPYATIEHTRTHIDFIRSKRFKEVPMDSPITRVMLRHVVGEVIAIQNRQGISAQTRGPGRPGEETRPPGQRLAEAANIVPRMYGGGETPPVVPSPTEEEGPAITGK